MIDENQTVREGINGIQYLFQKRIMNNYYYTQQQPTLLLKQPSQVLAPLNLQHSNHTVSRSHFTDRNHQDMKNSYGLSMPYSIGREGSTKQLHQATLNKSEQPFVIQTRSSGGIQNQRVLSDYQINGGGEGQLPVGGGYNIISNKIMQKSKNKGDLARSNSKAALNSSDYATRTPSIRYVESAIEGEKGDSKMEGIIEFLNSQMIKLTERIGGHEERIDRLQKNKRNEQVNGGAYPTLQMEKINQILSLAEKTEQRDDYRRVVKMIEELRENILELNAQIKTVGQAQPIEEIKLAEGMKEELLEAIKHKNQEMRQSLEKELAKKMAEMEQSWKHWKKGYEQQIGSVTSSVKKFQGKMTTLLYEQRILSTNTLSGGLSTGITKLPSKTDSAQKQNASTAILTSKTYYIDPSGYLLDKNKYYLLNQKNEQIRLTEKEIDLMKKHNIL